LRNAAVFAALLTVSGGATAYGFEPMRTLLPGVEAQALAIGDVSGDGLDDLVMLPTATPDNHLQVLVAIQQADGLLAAPVVVQFGTQGFLFGSVGLADMDDDGALDIVVGENFSLTILRNEGALQFSAHTLVKERGPQMFDFDDIDGDGHLDIVASTGGTFDGTFDVYHGDGGGGIRDKTTLGLPGANELHLVDINGDGRRDLAYARYDDLVILLRNEHGFATNPKIVPLGLHNRGNGVAFSDFNADGRMDFVAAKSVNSYDNPLLALYAQRADGRFRAAGALKSYDLPGVPRFHDMDGDGREDLVVPHGGWGEVGLYVADPKGLQIESLFQGYGAYMASQMGIGDLNGDGRPDIATASHFGGIAFLEGRDTAIEADLAAYAGLAPSAAAIRLQNHSAYTDTGPNYLTVDLEVRAGPFDIGALPAGCERQPWGAYGVRLTCNIDALAPGAHMTLTVPLLIGPRSGPTFLSVHAYASAGVRDMRPDNNIASKRMTIWPSQGGRRK
jgi:hypothetical protein